MPGVSQFAVKAGGTVPGLPHIRLSDIIDPARLSHAGAICPGCQFYQLDMNKTGSQVLSDTTFWCLFVKRIVRSLKVILGFFFNKKKHKENIVLTCSIPIMCSIPLILHVKGMVRCLLPSARRMGNQFHQGRLFACRRRC